MIGEAVLYAASRATHAAIESLSRRLTWVAIAVLFLVTAFVLGIIALYMLLEPHLGALRSVGIIAGGSALIGVLSLSMPWIIDQIEARKREQGSAVAHAAAAVDQEAKDAVDYFGALQIVSTAFLFGLGAARRLRR